MWVSVLGSSITDMLHINLSEQEAKTGYSNDAIASRYHMVPTYSRLFEVDKDECKASTIQLNSSHDTMSD